MAEPRPIADSELEMMQFLDVDETEDEVYAGPCTVWGWWITNTATAVRWLKWYDGLAADVAVGTTTPKGTFGIPGTAGGDDVAANMSLPRGIYFPHGLCIAATTGFAVNDTGAPGANDVLVTLWVKKG